MRVHSMATSLAAGCILLTLSSLSWGAQTKYYCPYNREVMNRRSPEKQPPVSLGFCSTDDDFIPTGTPYLEVTVIDGETLSRAGVYYRVDKEKENKVTVRAKSSGNESLTPMGLGAVGGVTGVAVDRVFTAIADMAVSRAKQLALDIAQEQIVTKCMLMTRYGMMNHLCKKLKEEPLLDLLKDYTSLKDAVVGDALDFLTSRYLTSVPVPFRATMKVIAELLYKYTVVRKAPQPEDLHPLWSTLRQSLVLMDDDSDMKAALMVTTTMMLASLELGTGKDILQWSVFRDLAAPGQNDPRYQKEYMEIALWAEKLIREKWPPTCAAQDAECEKKKRLQMESLHFSYEEFVKTHPQFLLEKSLWQDLSKYMKKMTSPKAQKVLNQFRLLLGSPDPQVLIPAVFSMIIDFMVDDKTLIQAPCGTVKLAPESPEDPSAPPPAKTLDKQQKRELVLDNLVLLREIQDSLSPVSGSANSPCGPKDHSGVDKCQKPTTVPVSDPCAFNKTIAELDTATDKLDAKLDEILKYLDELSLRPELGSIANSKKLKQKLDEFAKKKTEALEGYTSKLKVRNEADVLRLLIIRKLVLAVFAADHAAILRSFIELLQLHTDPSNSKLKKGIATLRLIVGLIEPGPEGEKPEQARERRIQLVEEFAGQMTTRKGRSGDWISSIGVSALMGFQVSWDHEGSDFSSDSFGERTLGPVLSLPLGYTLQHFRGKNGLHIMAYPLDLAQYARVQSAGEQVGAPDPTFYTALTFGIQVAFARLVRNVPLTVGLDVRYIPFINYTESVQQEDGTFEDVSLAKRQFQAMIFIGFNFPLFDFN